MAKKQSAPKRHTWMNATALAKELRPEIPLLGTSRCFECGVYRFTARMPGAFFVGYADSYEKIKNEEYDHLEYAPPCKEGK